LPEGHTIHRLARDLNIRMARKRVTVTSPQGRFGPSAAVVSGRVLRTAEAHGKHLFVAFGRDQWLHVHLGLIGSFELGKAPAPPPRGAVRLRVETAKAYGDLRGPTVCELLTDAGVAAVGERLGADPLRADADPQASFVRLSRSVRPVASLLLDQAIVSGVGNVFRAEVLFRHGVDPMLPGRAVSRDTFDAMWADLVELMASGVETGRIDTVRDEHTPEATGRAPRVDDHGGEVYVYRRAGQPCHVCHDEVRTVVLEGRNLFWCPTCQPAS